MALYDVEMNESAPQVTTSEAVSDGANDSLGYIWMDIQEITEENASPLVLKVKSELLGFPELDKTSYMNWKVNDENQLALSGEKNSWKIYPLFGYRGTRRLLACLDEFQAESHVVTEVYQTNPNLSLIFPFVNDADQLKQAITVLRQYGFTGKVGTMIELPSAYFDLSSILETGISKIVVGMNDLTSFVLRLWETVNGMIWKVQ